MNRAAAPVTSIEEMSLNRLWAAPKLPRLSFNHLAVSGCTVAVPSDQLGRWWASRQLPSVGNHDRPRRDGRPVALPRAAPVSGGVPENMGVPLREVRDHLAERRLRDFLL